MKHLFVLLVISLLTLFSCTKPQGDNSSNEESIPVLDCNPFFSDYYAGQTSIIPGMNLEKVTWSSIDPFTATADGNVVMFHHVGFTKLYSQGLGWLFVQVPPRYTDFDLPIVEIMSTSHVLIDDYSFKYNSSSGSTCFGYSRSYIEAIEWEKKKDYRSNKEILLYSTGNVNSPYICYFFENEKLTQCASLINLVSLDNLPKFLKERYSVIYVDTTNYTASFVHQYGEEEMINYIGGLAYSSQLGSLLLAFLPPPETKGISIEDDLSEMLMTVESVFSNN